MKQITLRLPDALHRELKDTADRNRRSLHAEILWRLEAEGSDDPQAGKDGK